MEKHFACRAEVEANQVGDRLVLYDKRKGRAIVLNPTGAVVWNNLHQPRSLGELAQALLDEYPDLGEDQATRDVTAYLDQLLGEDLVEPG